MALTILNPNICAHTVDTHKKVFADLQKEFSPRGAQQGLWVGQIIALPAEIQRWLCKAVFGLATFSARIVIYSNLIRRAGSLS